MAFLSLSAVCSCVTTKARYTGEIVEEKIFLPPEENEEYCFPEKAGYYLYIRRYDGKIWSIDVDYPMSLSLEPTLHETKDGFFLDFGKNGHRFFFKEINREPHLVKIGAKEIQPTSIKYLGEISSLIEDGLKEK